MTIFVDQSIQLINVRLQRGLESEDTFQSKESFEAYARDIYMTITHYLDYNGHFVDNVFMISVRTSIQTISFYIVNAHSQNVIVEK